MNRIRRLCSALFRRNRPALLRHPLDPDSLVRVTGYPLTRQEVRVLAQHWTEEYLDTAVSCRLTRSCGTTDLRVFGYTVARSRAAEAVLGEAEMDAVYDEASVRVRAKIGEEAWAGYQAGEALWAEEECNREDVEPEGDEGSGA